MHGRSAHQWLSSAGCAFQPDATNIVCLLSSASIASFREVALGDLAVFLAAVEVYGPVVKHGHFPGEKTENQSWKVRRSW